MTFTAQDATLYAGDDLIISYSVTDEDGDPLDITGVAIQYVVKDGNTVILSKTIASGITVTSLVGGTFEVALTPADTASLDPKVYSHGVVISVTVSEYATISTGSLTIMPKVRA